MIIDVIPEIKTGLADGTFSYLVPENLATQIKVGSIVSATFGKKTIRGVVSGLKEDSNDQKFELKSIKSINPDFAIPLQYLATAKWVSEYYLCSIGEAISLFLPPEMKRPAKQAESGKLKVESGSALTSEQQTIFDQLKNHLNGKGKKPALLFGVTGSGKTEIYIELVNECLELGKQAIVLVPEIMLTPQTVIRFQKIFGDKIALMHSGLSKSEKLECYQNFYQGLKPIIIGPRSALLVPSEKIGLIIIDEEHDDSYKQDQNPRYSAIRLAREIVKKNNALLLLGSATPSVESYQATKTGEYDLFILNHRFGQDQLPEATIVDLRSEIKLGNVSPISERLRQEIKVVLDNKRQILLFLNRRGTATFVSCRDCGYVVLCKNCSIPMIYHTNSKVSELSCHHCDYKVTPPHICPECGSSRIKFFGAGIEKIESEIRQIFPAARIRRVDSETMTKKLDYSNFYKEFKSGMIDIVIGTQMITKGLDISGIDLVGIISADTGLHLPQYKAHEKTFSMLTQVSGRSGRKDNRGKTIIQSYWPESFTVLDAALHNYQNFFDREIIERENFGYPPFTHLLRVIAQNTDKEKASGQLKKLALELKKRGIDFIGPGPCFYQRLHGKYRFHLIIKSKNWPDKQILELWRENSQFVWDVEPTNML